MTHAIHWLDWPAPNNVKACFTSREAGVSSGAFHSFNLARHVGDDEQNVEENRKLLNQIIGVQPVWMSQVHSVDVVDAVPENYGREADASVFKQPGQAAVVMTADCLPVFFASTDGTQAAVAHAGWRGLANGILENTIDALNPSTDLIAYLGPAIGPNRFEVGQDVFDAFCLTHPECVSSFKPTGEPQKYLADIYQLARVRLAQKGLTQVYGGQYCTFEEQGRFYSFRRDRKSGRMASLIWIE